jgi:hypothetical protein
MTQLSQIKPGADIIGADGVRVGTLDHVEDGRLKLTKTEPGDGQHRFVDSSLIARIEDGVVRLSAIGAAATTMDDAATAHRRDSDRLDEGLEETFPASDPVSAKHIT